MARWARVTRQSITFSDTYINITSCCLCKASHIERERERDTEEGFTEEVRSSNGGEAMRLIPRKGCVAPLLRRQTRAYSHLVGFIHIVHLPNRVETHLSLASLYPTARRQREPDRRNPFCFFTVADNVKSVKKAVTRIEL